MKSSRWYLLVVWMVIFSFMAGVGEAAAIGGVKLPGVSSRQDKQEKANPEKTADEWFEQGLAYHEQYLYDKAIHAYTKAAELDSTVAAVYINRGHAYAESGRYDAALADFSKAVELEPQDAETYYNRGVVYDAKEDYAQSLTNYTKAIELNPQYSDAHYNKAIALENLGRSQEAKASYAAFIQYAPADDPELPFARERLQALSR
ncbi:MAG: tetratricopeptide repeat protein [Sporomusaceae bacterium]|nr:tetratricopeptide repeat protein [Sporomusaceae bacterium]